jgi:hypothetical protein
MFEFRLPRGRRRVAFQPSVEVAERRAAPSAATLVSFPTLNQPWTPLIEDRGTPKTVKVTGVNYGEPGEMTTFHPKVKITLSPPKFVIIRLPSHTYHNPGTYTLKVGINNRIVSFPVTVGNPD